MSYNQNYRPQYGREPHVNQRQAYRPPPSLIEMVEQLCSDVEEIKRILYQNNAPLLQLPNINPQPQYSNRQPNNDMLYPTSNNPPPQPFQRQE
jgi:hypothetical protein